MDYRAGTFKRLRGFGRANGRGLTSRFRVPPAAGLRLRCVPMNPVAPVMTIRMLAVYYDDRPYAAA